MLTMRSVEGICRYHAWRTNKLVCMSGEIDRKKLGDVVFAHPELRKQLNAATHPLVTLELVKQLIWHWLTFHFVVVSNLDLTGHVSLGHLCVSNKCRQLRLSLHCP